MKNLIFALAMLVVATQGIASPGSPDISKSWKMFEPVLDYVDVDERRVVAGDREFSVPMNTPLFDAGGRAIALNRLQVGQQIRVYLDRNSTEPTPVAKRIELLK